MIRIKCQKDDALNNVFSNPKVNRIIFSGIRTFLLSSGEVRNCSGKLLAKLQQFGTVPVTISAPCPFVMSQIKQIANIANVLLIVFTTG